jgi:hypothetical protein
VPCSTPKNVGKTAVPALQAPFLHDFLQEKNILRGLQNRVYAGPFTFVELSFATVVCEQISRQVCVPFCLKRGGFFEGAKLLGSIWPETLDQGWPAKVSGMGEDEGVRKRRLFQWSKQAKDLAREYKQRMIAGQHLGQVHRSALVARLVEISGNPREACLRFLCRSGAAQKRSYREWTKPEQRRLLDLITTMPVDEAAKTLRRPAGSVRSMLHRLGIGGRTGREWFTKYSLSRALHTRPEEIQKWIDSGWLRSRSLPSASMPAKIIYADDFCQFVKEHGRAAVSRRLTYDALWFVQNYVFPPSHADLLSVRGTYKKQDTREEEQPAEEAHVDFDSEADGHQKT